MAMSGDVKTVLDAAMRPCFSEWLWRGMALDALPIAQAGQGKRSTIRLQRQAALFSAVSHVTANRSCVSCCKLRQSRRLRRAGIG